MGEKESDEKLEAFVEEARRRVDYQIQSVSRAQEQAQDMVKIMLTLIGSILTFSYIITYVILTLLLSGNANLLPTPDSIISTSLRTFQQLPLINESQAVFLSLIGLAIILYTTFEALRDLLVFFSNAIDTLAPARLIPSVDSGSIKSARESETDMKQFHSEIINQYETAIRRNEDELNRTWETWNGSYSKLRNGFSKALILIGITSLLLSGAPLSAVFLIGYGVFQMALETRERYTLERIENILRPYYWTDIPLFYLFIIFPYIVTDEISSFPDTIVAALTLLMVLALIAPFAFGSKLEFSRVRELSIRYSIMTGVGFFCAVFTGLSDTFSPLSTGFIGPLFLGIVLFPLWYILGVTLSSAFSFGVSSIQRFWRSRYSEDVTSD